MGRLFARKVCPNTHSHRSWISSSSPGNDGNLMIHTFQRSDRAGQLSSCKQVQITVSEIMICYDFLMMYPKKLLMGSTQPPVGQFIFAIYSPVCLIGFHKGAKHLTKKIHGNLIL